VCINPRYRDLEAMARETETRLNDTLVANRAMWDQVKASSKEETRLKAQIDSLTKHLDRVSVLLAEVGSKEGQCRYCDDEINGVTDRGTQTEPAEDSAALDPEDPMSFLREHPPPGSRPEQDGGYTTTQGHYVSGWHRRNFQQYREGFARAALTDLPPTGGSPVERAKAHAERQRLAYQKAKGKERLRV